ncbi:MAG: hypothetical protein PHR44_07000 [Candidatus Omnitrophica bacterium]|nr:hypothetical protein [Candidatus Omnitrophota bacterium]
MRKYKSKLIILTAFSIILICLFIFLNIKVGSKQGINGEVKLIKVPLYLKILDFYDRHYNYKWLADRVAGDAYSDKEKALRLFEWTYNNILKVPEGLPVIDDHVWHIIVRGYGASDQASDVFTTLCNYLNLDAFFMGVGPRRIALSFVKLDNKWRVFDPYRGVYFKDGNGNIADIDTLKSLDCNIVYLKELPGLDYSELFRNFPYPESVGFTRANIQSPMNRLKYQIQKWAGNGKSRE